MLIFAIVKPGLDVGSREGERVVTTLSERIRALNEAINGLIAEGGKARTAECLIEAARKVQQSDPTPLPALSESEVQAVMRVTLTGLCGRPGADRVAVLRLTLAIVLSEFVMISSREAVSNMLHRAADEI